MDDKRKLKLKSTQILKQQDKKRYKVKMNKEKADAVILILKIENSAQNAS